VRGVGVGGDGHGGCGRHDREGLDFIVIYFCDILKIDPPFGFLLLLVLEVAEGELFVLHAAHLDDLEPALIVSAE
jgi:predicted SnoaL-like aldol condensation-catalyzing enzyme